MGTEIDKITVTFYGKDEVEKAADFRKKAIEKYHSLNNALKKILLEWAEKNKS